MLHILVLLVESSLAGVRVNGVQHLDHLAQLWHLNQSGTTLCMLQYCVMKKNKLSLRET